MGGWGKCRYVGLGNAGVGVGKSAGVGDWGKCRCVGLGKVQVWGVGKSAGVGDWGKCRCVGLGRVQVWGVGKSAGSLHPPSSCLDLILKTVFQFKTAPAE